VLTSATGPVARCTVRCHPGGGSPTPSADAKLTRDPFPGLREHAAAGRRRPQGGRVERHFVRRWDGVVHAVMSGSDATLCGRALSTLHPFPDHAFDGDRLDDVCVPCLEAAERGK
jgi:hypothetical protein